MVRNAITLRYHTGNERVPFTHPDYATRVDHLFACGGKRVKINLGYFSSPLTSAFHCGPDIPARALRATMVLRMVSYIPVLSVLVVSLRPCTAALTWFKYRSTIKVLVEFCP